MRPTQLWRSLLDEDEPNFPLGRVLAQYATGIISSMRYSKIAFIVSLVSIALSIVVIYLLLSGRG